MVNYSSSQQLDKVFSALADPTRRAILDQLAKEPTSVTELAKPFKMSLPATVKHLKVLEEAGLLISNKSGRVRLCQIEPKTMQAADTWMSRYRRFWDERLDALTAYLESAQGVEENND